MMHTQVTESEILLTELSGINKLTIDELIVH